MAATYFQRLISKSRSGSWSHCQLVFTKPQPWQVCATFCFSCDQFQLPRSLQIHHSTSLSRKVIFDKSAFHLLHSPSPLVFRLVRSDFSNSHLHLILKILLRIDRFAVTSNNVSYASTGNPPSDCLSCWFAYCSRFQGSLWSTGIFFQSKWDNKKAGAGFLCGVTQRLLSPKLMLWKWGNRAHLIPYLIFLVRRFTDIYRCQTCSF